MTDVIDLLAGLPDGAEIRAARPAARLNAQKSYEALFEVPEGSPLALDERLAIAHFVALLHRDEPAVAHYGAALAARPAAADLRPAVEAAAAALTEGPYGSFPPGPLSAEDMPGPTFTADPAIFGPHLAAGLDHAHLLVFHPREAGREAMARLAAAGWTATEIVTLSQMVAFLSFQIRAAAGLRVLAAAS